MTRRGGRRTARGALGGLAIFGGLVLAAVLRAWLPSPPVYDGLVLPQQPYNYVSPPPNLASSNVPPSSGEATFPVQNGKVAGGGVETDDRQAIAFFGLDAIHVSASAVSVKLRIDPVTNPPPWPAGWQIHGNVYKFSGVEQPSGAPATVTSFQITLRYPPGPFQSLWFYDGTTWHELSTKKAPNGDPFAGATLTAFGEAGAGAPRGAQGDTIITILARLAETYGLLAFIIVFGVVAVVQEIRRRRKKA